MGFSNGVFTHLYDWAKDQQRQRKIIDARLEEELDGIDAAFSAFNGFHAKAFGCQFDGTTDDTANLQAAIDRVAESTGTYGSGGFYGGVLHLPKGAAIISDTIVLKTGVTLVGEGQGATLLKMASTFASNKHFIQWGTDDGLASLHGGIIGVQLYSEKLDADANMAMVRTTDAQEGNILWDVQMYGGNRTCLRFTGGDGGPAYFYCREIETLTHTEAQVTGSRTNPAIHADYAGLLCLMDNINQTGVATAHADCVGLLLKGGRFDIRGYHAEGDFPKAIHITIPTANDGSARIQSAIGGAGVADLITIHSDVDLHTVTGSGFWPNGATNTIVDNRSGGVGSTGSVNIHADWEWLPLTRYDTTGVLIQGTTGANYPASGYIGEPLASNRTNAAALTLTTDTDANVTSRELTPGYWLLTGVVGFTPSGATVTEILAAGFNTTSATMPGVDSGQRGGTAFGAGVTGGGSSYVTIPPTVFNVSSTTTVYLVARAKFTTSNMVAWGNIYARRVG